ncbi:hypothetical protein KLA_03662 [Cellulophaga geojensis KL-A]|uniref:Tetratricopeptide repeat protein n=1 Tax=Cellulophaga geojensis KL-A TaxID=1328323 RepID=A0ABN0RR59_9FLAO|nr:tetratricopeptide repeat protein [Cellulophaga geojensis]EWH14430.1 hypothetical protein KLA_03662 [Cellulophaga geojensis KL-A]
MENIFEKAFNRNRNGIYKRGGRQLNELNSLLDNSLPEYVIYYSQAQKYYEIGNLNDAFNNINKAIELSDVDDWKQYAFKANVLEEAKHYEDAIKNYEIAIDINPNDVYVYALYHQIGWCYLNLKDDEKAVEFYTYAINLKKQHPNSEYNEDLEGIDNGVLLGKKFEQMYINRGNSLKNIGKLEDARQDCISAIKCNEQYSNPYLLLSQIFDLAGHKEESMKFLKHASDMGNQNATRIFNNGGF